MADAPDAHNGAPPLRMCKLFLLTVAPETQDSSFLLSQSNDCLLRSNSVFRNFRVRTRADFHSFLRGKPCWQLDRKLLLAASRVPGVSWAERLQGCAGSFETGLALRPGTSLQETSPESEPCMTPEEITNIANELKRLGTELNLSDNQKDQLKAFLTEKYEKLQEYRKQNPNVSTEEIRQYVAKNRASGREKIEKFLTPDQLAKWDAEVSKAKDFLSRRAASA